MDTPPADLRQAVVNASREDRWEEALDALDHLSNARPELVDDSLFWFRVRLPRYIQDHPADIERVYSRLMAVGQRCESPVILHVLALMQMQSGDREAGIALNQRATLLQCARKVPKEVSLVHRGSAGEWPGPDFLILGVQKTATSSLYGALNEHPFVLPALRKELLFFSESTTERYGREFYRSCFPDTRGTGYVTGEASATYFSNLPVLDRVISACPKARFVVSVRAPAARAISDYHMKVRDGREKRPMEQAFREELELLKKEGELPPLLLENHYRGIDTRYILKGMYFHTFGLLVEKVPDSRILVVDTGELQNDDSGVMNRIHSFLGIRPLERTLVTQPVRANVGQYDRQSAIAMSDQLAEFYRPYNERFFAMAGRRFDW